MDSLSDDAECPAVERGRGTVNGVSLHYVMSGPTAAPPIILLHGFPQTWVIRRSIPPRLAGRSRVVAVDLRGDGDSDMPPGEEGYDEGDNGGGHPGVGGSSGVRTPPPHRGWVGTTPFNIYVSSWLRRRYVE